MNETENDDWLDPETISFMDLIFNCFYGMYPSTKFVLKTQDCEHNAKQWWHISFQEVGIINKTGKIDKKLCSNGITSLPYLKQQFMPSCGQFIDLCFNPLTKDDIKNIECDYSL